MKILPGNRKRPDGLLRKKLNAFCFFLLVATGINAQKTIASPRDSVAAEIEGAVIRINYGSPAVKGRQVWGKLVPYGQVWRAGANEATTFYTSKPLLIEDKELPAGKYSFFVIPERAAFTIIFNKVPNQWGAFEYDQKQDELRVSVQPQQADSLYEHLRFSLEKDQVRLKWEKLVVPIHVHAKK